MKKIMTRAWNLYKNNDGSLFSECLKESWKIEKELRKPKKKTYSDYIKSLKQKNLEFFFGKSVKKVSNKYFTFDHVIDNDNIIIVTNNIKLIKDSYVLIVGNNKAVYLKDWQVRPIRNYWEEVNAYAVKLNRNFFKTYTFRNNFDDFYFEKEETFDDLKEIASTQTMEVSC